MVTPDTFERASKLNQFFEKNLPNVMKTLTDHAEAADYVPLDTRFLTEPNKKLLDQAIRLLPQELRSKVILLKSGG